MDFVVHQVASAIDQASLQWLREFAHLGLFNDDRDAARALLALADASSSRISDVRDVRNFQDTFRRLWGAARQSGQPTPGRCVPVMVAGDIECASKVGGGIALAYFDDERDTLKRQLLEK